MGAAAKRKADRCVKAGGNICCASEFVKNNSKDGCIKYILVPLVETYACRDLLEWFVTPKKVSGTMQVHDVMVLEHGRSIAVRRMSCFKPCCWDPVKLEPVQPQRQCQTNELCVWAKAELYNPQVYAKLDKKRKKIEADNKRKEKAQKEEEARQRNDNLERYEKKEWVAAIWSGVWWIGQIEHILDHQDSYTVNFMHPVVGSQVNQCHIDWPSYKDLTAIAHSDILCTVSAPVPALHRQKWCYTLPNKEIKSIIQIFESFGV